MPEDFIASTQYDDLKGTIAIDEFQAIGTQSFSLLEMLADHADMPEGHIIVGFEIHSATPMKLEDHGIMIYNVVSVRPEDVGHGINQWKEYADAHGELPVHRFRGRVNFDDFRRLIHRLDIRVAVSGLEGVNVQVQVK
jgi:hypothetical protein